MYESLLLLISHKRIQAVMTKIVFVLVAYVLSSQDDKSWNRVLDLHPPAVIIKVIINVKRT